MKTFLMMGMLGLAGVAQAEVGPAYAMANGDRFTHFAGFQLSGDHTLRDVTSFFGEAPLVNEPKYNAMQASVCYKTEAGYVAFLSRELVPDLATRAPMLMGVSVSADAPNKQCVPVAAGKEPGPLLLGGLQPGITMGDYKTLVNDKSYTGDELLSAVYVYPVGNLRAQVSVIPDFARGRMRSVQVWKTLTD